MTGRRVLVLAGLLGGCSILPQRAYVAQRDWPLEVRRPGTLPPDPRGPVLLVRPVRAGPGLLSQGLQSVAEDGSVKTAYYERWSVPPAEAVEEQLRRWLAASGLFAAVLSPGSRARADLALEAELLALIATPAQAASRAALGIVLVDLRPSQPRLLLQAEATGGAALPGGEPADLAESGRDAVAAMLGDVETDLAPFARRIAATGRLPER